jgi:hypothetical protein
MGTTPNSERARAWRVALELEHKHKALAAAIFAVAAAVIFGAAMDRALELGSEGAALFFAIAGTAALMVAAIAGDEAGQEEE